MDTTLGLIWKTHSISLSLAHVHCSLLWAFIFSFIFFFWQLNRRIVLSVVNRASQYMCAMVMWDLPQGGAMYLVLLLWHFSKHTLWWMNWDIAHERCARSGERGGGNGEWNNFKYLIMLHWRDLNSADQRSCSLSCSDREGCALMLW